MTNQSRHQLASSDNEAQQKFNKYKKVDPYPDIAPALLNSADIYDYVASTGMIFPFDPEKLKSASYAVPILGRLVYWDEQDEKQIIDIIRSNKTEDSNKYINKLKTKLGAKQSNESAQFILRKNSIAFVTLEPMLRLPDYIAIRFNLKISNVYRGLLLGTGPLVDPGFTGRLSIPLHNLTNNDYIFSGSGDLIWMEFTKLSPNKRWVDRMISYSSRQGYYRKFRNDPNTDVEDYLSKAIKSPCPFSIRSSIPEVFRNAEKASAEAAKTVRFFQGLGLISVLGLLIALGALFFQVLSLIREKDELINVKGNQIDYLQKEIDSMKKEITNLKKNR